MFSQFDENVFTDCQVVVRRSENGFQCDLTRLVIPGKKELEENKVSPEQEKEQEKEVLEKLGDSFAEFIVSAKKEGNELKKEEIKKSLENFYVSVQNFRVLQQREYVKYPIREKKSYVFNSLPGLQKFLEEIFTLESI